MGGGSGAVLAEEGKNVGGAGGGSGGGSAEAPMLTKPTTTSPTTTETKRTYLLWEPGFFLRFVASLVLLAGGGGLAASIPQVQFFVWEMYQELLFMLMDGANRMAWWSVIGLLSSSCCALQLMLNALNFGCAGFNTTLGPLRPFFCALTVCTQGVVWYTAYDKPFQRLYVGACTSVVVVLTLLPEMLALRVQRGAKRRSPRGGVPRVRAALGLEGMGCAACTKKVSEVLDSMPEVVGREISLERKCAELLLDAAPAAAAATLLPEIVQRLRDAGFEASPEGEVEALGGDEGLGGGRAEDVAAAAALAGGGSAGLSVSVFAGLISSSCCLLQLGLNVLASLNVLHVGCAGFNKALGPLRPQLRLLSGAWLSASWALCLWKRWPRRVAGRLLVQTAVCLTLMFLPEFLLMLGGRGVAPPTSGAQVLEVEVEGMGCEACQLHVQGVMDRASGVVGSTVDFEGGRAELVVNKDWAFDFDALAKQLEDDGYTAKLRVKSDL